MITLQLRPRQLAARMQALPIGHSLPNFAPTLPKEQFPMVVPRRVVSPISRFLVAVLSACIPLTGCSLMVPSQQAVAITASEPDAQIIVDGNHVGTGSASVMLQRNRAHTVVARLGDRSGATSIGTKISTTGVLDIIGGILFLVPLIGLAGPGFWSLDPDSVAVSIPPATAQAPQ